MRPLLRSLSLLLLVACASAGSGPDVGGEAGVADAAAPGAADADTCPGDPCQLAPQCGCPGEACDIDPDAFAEGGTMCRPIAAQGTELANCRFLDDCAPGYVCLGGQCRKYCNSVVSCGPGAHCLVQPVYQAAPDQYEPIPGVMTCSKACKPDQQSANGCPPDPQFGCHLRRENPNGSPEDDGDEFYRTDCSSAPASGGRDGTDCAAVGDSACAPGFECILVTVGEESSSVCKQLCVVPGGPCETAGTTCTSFADPKPVIGGVEYGACL